MKFTDELKEKIDNAGSEEEVKAILEDVKNGAEEAGVILNDAELDLVAGGLRGRWDISPEPYSSGNNHTE